MSKATFTQEPWEVLNYEFHDTVIRTAREHAMDENAICSIIKGANSVDAEERAANATLIAAAPELYTLLARLEHELLMDDMSNYSRAQAKAIKSIPALLAKARGDK